MIIKTLIALILSCSIAMAGQGMGPGPGVKGYASGYSCSGDFLAGAIESFESGASSYCTTGVSSYNTPNPYDTSFYFTGTHGLIGGSGYAMATLSSADNDLYTAFVFHPADAPDYSQSSYLFTATDGAGSEYHPSMYVRHMDTGGVAQDSVSLCTTASECGGDYFTVVPGDTYFISLRVRGLAGTGEMKMWHRNGTAWDAMSSSSSGSTVYAAFTVGSYNVQNLFLGHGSLADQFDDWRLSLSGSAHLEP